MAGIDLPDSKWIDKIVASVCDSTEFSGNNENGRFEVSVDRKELIITTKLDDITSLKLYDYKELNDLMWRLSHIFSNLLE